MAKGKSSPVAGIIFIILGFAFLFRDSGIFDFPFREYFANYWPVGLILAGIAIIYDRKDVGYSLLILTIVLLFFYGIGNAIGGAIDLGGQAFDEACIKGSGNVSEVTRAVLDFTKISASNGVNVHIVEGQIGTVTIAADDNIIDSVRTEVKNGELAITVDVCTRNRLPIEVYVATDDIEAIEASVAATVDSEKKIVSEDIKLEASSAANIDLEIEAAEVSMEASSAAKIKVSGEANKVYADASTSSKIEAFELEAEDVRAKASTAAEVQVYASEKIDADASTAGIIEYKGGPSDVSKDESSAGNVKDVD